MIRAALVAGFAFALSIATAAELPQRGLKLKNPDAKTHTCLIDGQPGVETPGFVCVRVSGYVSSHVSVGGLKH